VVDLGIVEVEGRGCSVPCQGAKERVYEDIEALAQIVAPLHDIAAVAVDEG